MLCASEPVGRELPRARTCAPQASGRAQARLRPAAPASGGSWQRPTSCTRTTGARACSAARRPAARRPGRSIRCTGCPRRSQRGSAAPDAPDPPGVSRARLAWLEHGYLPLEAGLTRLGHVVAPSQAMADFLLAHGFLASAAPRDPARRRDRRTKFAPATRTSVLVAGVACEPRVLEGRSTCCSRRLQRCEAPLRLEVYGDGSLRGRLERQARTLAVDARFHGFVADVRARLPRARRARSAVTRRQLAARRSSRRWRRACPSWPRVSAASRSSSSTARRGWSSSRRARARLADALEQLAGDPDRGSRARAATGAERAAEHFSPDGVARADCRPLRGTVRILHVIQELGTGGAEQVLLSTYRGARAAGHEVFVAAAPGPLAAAARTPSRSRSRSSSGARGGFRPPRTCRAPGRPRDPARRRARAQSDDGVRDRSRHAPRPAAARPRAACTASRRRTGRGRSRLLRALRPAAGRVRARRGRSARAARADAAGDGRRTPSGPPRPRPTAPSSASSPGRALVLAVGRLVEQKNHALAIAAIAEVPERDPRDRRRGPLRPGARAAGRRDRRRRPRPLPRSAARRARADGRGRRRRHAVALGRPAALGAGSARLRHAARGD